MTELIRTYTCAFGRFNIPEDVWIMSLRLAASRPGYLKEWCESKYIEHAALTALGQSDLIRDAERYRWLREQDWFTSNLCVVMAPKSAVKLGNDCPSWGRLDAAIDKEMAK